MITLGQIFTGNTRNAFKEVSQLSFVLQIFRRSKTLENIRNSNKKRLSSIATIKLSNSTKLNSTHYVTNLNKSTDAKNSSRLFLVDKAGKHYSKEEDKKLLEHVNRYGKSSSVLKSLSEDFGRSFNSIVGRIRILESTNECDGNNERRAWEFREDEKLVNYVFKLKSIKSANISSIKDTTLKDFVDIAKELKRSPTSVNAHWRNYVIPCLKPHMKQLVSSTNFKKDILKLIEDGYIKTTTLRGYSKADDKFIIRQVKKYGYEHETFVKIAKKLGRKNAYAVKLHFDYHLSQTPNVKGPFSQEEDEKILDYIKVHGRSDKSFKNITNELGRGSRSSVRNRHDRLVSKNEFETNATRKNWELDEDYIIIFYIFQLKNVKDDSCDQLEKVKANDFKDIGKEIKRSSHSCYNRWMGDIVPTLKTCIMKLPMTNDWKKDLLHHIVENNVKTKKELDIEFILKEIAPAQTSRSLLCYLDDLKRENIGGVKKQSKLPLCELASKRLIEKSPISPIFNEDNKNAQKRQEWSTNIIAYYKNLM